MFTLRDMERFATEAWGPLSAKAVERWVEFNQLYFGRQAAARACGHYPCPAVRQAPGVLLILQRLSRRPHHHAQRAQGSRIAARRQQHLAPRDDPSAIV